MADDDAPREPSPGLATVGAPKRKPRTPPANPKEHRAALLARKKSLEARKKPQFRLSIYVDEREFEQTIELAERENLTVNVMAQSLFRAALRRALDLPKGAIDRYRNGTTSDEPVTEVIPEMVTGFGKAYREAVATSQDDDAEQMKRLVRELGVQTT